MTGAHSLVTLRDVEAAAARLLPVAVKTPLVQLSALSDKLGVRCSVKAESFQRTGSFKFRGAYNFVSLIDKDVRSRGVVAPSSGNHGQAVACVAQMFGIPATIVMPTTVTAIKREGVERFGGRAILAGTTTEDRMNAALEVARETGATMIPPYDDARIIAGQATCGLEIVNERSSVGTVIVPVGGGGLSAGIALVIKSVSPRTRVIVVEPEGAAKLSAARSAGEPVKIDAPSSAADGLLAVRIGSLNFAHLDRFADEVIAVTESEIRDACRYMFSDAKLVSEPSGATALAALLAGKAAARGETVVVLSGGNVAVEALTKFIA